jgi:hypothetical protein
VSFEPAVIIVPVDKQTIWNALNSILAVVGIIVGAWAGFYCYTQVKLMRQGNARREAAEREIEEWSARAQYVVLKLVGFAGRWSNGGNGVPGGPLYGMVLSSLELRRLVESYLIQMDQSANRADARMLTPDMLQRKGVQDTIKRVEECFAAVRKDNPAIAHLASLD